MATSQTSLPQSTTTSGITAGSFGEFFDAAFSFRDNASYRGNKRFFITFTPTGSFLAIRTTTTGSIPDGETGLLTRNLAELSTGELSSINKTSFTLNLSEKTPLNQNYQATGSVDISPNTKPSPPLFESGSYVISRLNDSVPSLLINLPKNQHLSDGLGRRGFIIIPENLHPHIKRNLVHFLAKAGVPLGLDQIPALDRTFEKLK
tara:strand:- start:2621 stop:3235 length:615 start_codon:yes stop_codon:yes gene_type:complete